MIFQYYPQAAHPFRFELNKDMNFAAAHFLPHPNAGVCAEMHGHTYVANLTIVGDELDELNMLVNFSDLKRMVHGKYDHSVINAEYAEGQLPTTEFLAQQIWRDVQDVLDDMDHQPLCVQVILRETPTAYVIYRPQFEVTTAFDEQNRIMHRTTTLVEVIERTDK